MTEAEDDVAIKLLHTADWHLGARFPAFADADEKRLRQQRLQTVRQVLGLAELRRVHAVVVAGDIFDGPEPEEQWWRALAQTLREQAWTERQMFLLPGNHDPLTETSVWKDARFRQSLPPWCHVVDRDDFSYAFGDEAVLHAVPCRRTAGQLDVTAKLPARAPDDRRVRIALLHGQTLSIRGFANNFHIPEDTGTRLGFDYVALGDTHSLRIVAGADSTLVYPGTPEPTRFSETDAGHAVLALLSRRAPPIVQSQPIAGFRWRDASIHSLDELRALLADDLRQTVLRVQLALRLRADDYRDAERMLAELAGTDVDPGRAAILFPIDTGGLDLDTDEPPDLEALPDSVRAAAERLIALGHDPVRGAVARRALGHLLQLTKEARTNP